MGSHEWKPVTVRDKILFRASYFTLGFVVACALVVAGGL